MTKVQIIAGVLWLLVLLAGVYVYRTHVATSKPSTDTPTEVVTEPVVIPATTTNSGVPAPSALLNVATFSGILEEVNTGCFADGECYVVVGGKHITTLLGRRQEVVGSVIGVPGFGDLENFIGEQVEVSAKKLVDGIYTLYGSADFYIKLSSVGTMVQMGETTTVAGIQITPLQLLEDSRCPIDVFCIQAGTVRLRARLVSASGTFEQIFVLNEAVETEVAKITLVHVLPKPESTTSVEQGQYVFYFGSEMAR